MPWVEDAQEPSGWKWHPNKPDYPDPGVLGPRQDLAGFAHTDGSVYERVDPDLFDSFDEVDSTTIEDPGAPE